MEAVQSYILPELDFRSLVFCSCIASQVLFKKIVGSVAYLWTSLRIMVRNTTRREKIEEI